VSVAWEISTRLRSQPRRGGAGEIGAVEIRFGEVALFKDTLLEARHAKEREVQLALLKQHALPLRIAAYSTGETGGEEFDALEDGGCHIDVGEIR